MRARPQDREGEQVNVNDRGEISQQTGHPVRGGTTRARGAPQQTDWTDSRLLDRYQVVGTRHVDQIVQGYDVGDGARAWYVEAQGRGGPKRAEDRMWEAERVVHKQRGERV